MCGGKRRDIPRVVIARVFILLWLIGGAPVIIPAAGRVLAADMPPPASPVIAARAPGTTFIRRLDAGGFATPRVGLPVRLKIPAIAVDAAVEYVGKTPDGAMDAPQDYNNTAWYRLGPRPGEVGNAAIDGHVDSTTGPAVFWNLRTLQRGDAIIVTGDDGVERQFVVIVAETYARAEMPLERVFGPTAEVRLNLITCDATSAFDRTRGEYARNLVVYAEAAPPA